MREEAEAQLGAFFDALRVQQRASPHTLTSYSRDLARLKEFCERREIGTWTDLTSGHIREHIVARHREQVGSRSLQRELSAIRGFFAFLIKRQESSRNPARGVRAPKAPRKLPRLLDVDQMVGLLEAPAADSLERRDLAMWELFYSSGLRLSELTGLNLPDLDLRAGMVLIREGKGRKSRHVPLGRCAANAVGQWLALRADFAPSHTSCASKKRLLACLPISQPGGGALRTVSQLL